MTGNRLADGLKKGKKSVKKQMPNDFPRGGRVEVADTEEETEI